jgi:uncharacterized membrane protein YjjB (DUF3815 family)
MVFAVGIWLHWAAPFRSVPWMLLVLYTAYGGQAIGDALFGGQLSGFFGAVAMTPVALWMERLPGGPPKQVTFLPAFWLLVPGATGLIGVTAIVGNGSATAARALTDVLFTMIAISLGVLVGTAAYGAADSRLRRARAALRGRLRSPEKHEVPAGRRGYGSRWRSGPPGPRENGQQEA